MAQSGLTLSIRFQNSAGDIQYQGNGTSNLRLWGAVFELGNDVTDRAQGAFAGSYRYIRSLGSAGDLAGIRYGYDDRIDTVTIGGAGSPTRLQTGTGTDKPLEHTVFNYVKRAKRAGGASAEGSINFNGSSSATTAGVTAPGTASITYEWWFRHNVTSAAVGYTQGMLCTRLGLFNSTDGIDVSIKGAGSYGSINVLTGAFTTLLGGLTTGVGTDRKSVV
jgi:hypothetical protein